MQHPTAYLPAMVRGDCANGVMSSRPLPEHVAFDSDNMEHHAAIGTSDFPMDEVVARLDGVTPPSAELEGLSPMTLAADGLHEILRWVWQPGKCRRPKLQASFRRFLSLSMTLDPALLGNLTYRELGGMMGCTRAALSKQSILFCRQFGGLQFRRQHGGRGNMRAAMLRSHQKRKRNEAITTHPTA